MRLFVRFFLIFLPGLFILTAYHKKDSRPTIIVFYSDELDPGYVSAYGDTFQTPHIDNLAYDPAYQDQQSSLQGILSDRPFVNF